MFGICRNRKLSTIPTNTNPRKSASPSYLLSLDRFAILLDRDALNIVGSVKRPGNRPVVRNGHLFPCAVVKTRRLSTGHVAAMKAPARTKKTLPCSRR